MNQSNRLKNDELSIEINDFGAELTDITDIKTKEKYLWNGDEKFWKRHSPVLFPIVGSLKNKEYNIGGITYSMDQHGFARDSQFQLISKTENEIWYQLKANDETFKIYPYNFTLEIGYRLVGRKIIVKWKVINEGISKLYFQIGAHPAFLCPFKKEEKQQDYFIDFHMEEEPQYSLLNENGLMSPNKYLLNTKNGVLPISENLFDYDALIIENNQTQKVSLLRPDKTSYVTVSFDAPLFGLWSPAKTNAPFICIEPWYGRCDREDFNGNFKEREWMNIVEADEIFRQSYEIEIG